MSINCKSLKEYIENAFSMPFVVNSTMTDGESRYSCHPDNDGEVLFNSTVYIHNQCQDYSRNRAAETRRRIYRSSSYHACINVRIWI